MKVVTPGAKYEVKDFSGGGSQVICFNHKDRKTGDYVNGTTVEELLLVLKHKLEHFQRIAPSEYNAASLEHLQHIRGEFYARLQEKIDHVKAHDNALPEGR